jgi:hypothetical protein
VLRTTTWRLSGALEASREGGEGGGEGGAPAGFLSAWVKRSMGSSFMGSMKNLSPDLYDVATTPSCSLMVKCCARVPPALLLSRTSSSLRAFVAVAGYRREITGRAGEAAGRVERCVPLC